MKSDRPVILVGLIENPPLVPACVAHSAFVADFPRNCAHARLGWPAQLLLLIHKALQGHFTLKVSRLQFKDGESFSGLVNRSFREGAMDLNGVPMGWTFERAQLGSDILPLPALWHPYEFVVSKALILSTVRPISARIVEPLPFGLLLLCAVALTALLHSHDGAPPLPTLFGLLSSLLGQFTARLGLRVGHAAWILASLLLIIEFNIFLKTSFLREEVRPFTSSEDLAARLASRQVSFAVEASKSHSSFFQKVRLPNSPGQRALKAAFRSNPLFLTDSVDATRALIRDPTQNNYVFLYRKSYEPIPDSHYRQVDLGSGQIMSQYFLRSNPACTKFVACPDRRLLNRFSEHFLMFVADNVATMVVVYNHDNFIRKEPSPKMISDSKPIELGMYSQLAFISSILLCTSVISLVFELIFACFFLIWTHFSV